MQLRRLAPSDDRSRFDSGTPALDHFFRQFAGQHQTRGVSTTYVVVDGGEIVAFATVVAAEILPELLGQAAKKLPRFSVPVLRLARLATATAHRGRGHARELMKVVFGLALAQQQLAGCVAVVVDAKPDSVSYYRSLGFEEMSVADGAVAGTTPMFLPVRSIPADAALTTERLVALLP